LCMRLEVRTVPVGAQRGRRYEHREREDHERR
jgi:hypothetical protein